MTDNTRIKPVVAIGGMGGSGTRLVASVFQGMGIDLGSVLNGALDNLAFTFFLKRPLWFKNHPCDADIREAVELFNAHMVRDFNRLLRAKDKGVFDKIIADLDAHLVPTGADENVAQHLLNHSTTAFEIPKMWGWKEPNTHIFLPQVLELYPSIKYVHVVRHGLDMAFSSNQQQLLNWESFICPHNVGANKSLASRSLDFWIASTKRAIAIGQEQLGSDFMLLRYEDFCDSPVQSLEAIKDFLGTEISETKLKELHSLFSPSTIGRYLENDLNQFTEAQLDQVRELGFEILGS